MTTSPIDGAILHQLSSFLEVEDIYRAGGVCVIWKETLNNPTLWKEICLIHYPDATRSMLSAQPDCDLKRLAKTLSKDGNRVQKQPTYRSSVGLDNYFAIVEFYRVVDPSQGKRRKDVLGSFSCDFHPEGSDVVYRPQTGIFVNGANALAALPELTSFDASGLERFLREGRYRHFLFSLYDAAGFYPSGERTTENTPKSLRAMIRLFRRDNQKSIVIPASDLVYQETRHVDSFDEVWFFIDDSCKLMELKPSLTTAEGWKYSAMMRQKKIKYVVASLEYHLKIQAPEGEAAWFDSFIREFATSTTCSAKGREITSFKCEIQKFGMKFSKSTKEGGYNTLRRFCDRHDEEELEEFKVALDGLDWQ